MRVSKHILFSVRACVCVSYDSVFNKLLNLRKEEENKEKLINGKSVDIER